MSVQVLSCIPGYYSIWELGNMVYDRLSSFIWNLFSITMKKYWAKKSVEWFERLFWKTWRCFEARCAGLIHKREVGGHQPIINLLFVGSSNGGKKSIIKSTMNKDCIDDLLHAPGVKHARNKDAFGRNVYAVKCPGFQQRKQENYKTLTDDDNFKNALETIKHFDAIVFCIPYAMQFRKEEIEYIEKLRDVWVPSEFKDKFILAMSRAEDFDKNKQEMCEEKHFDLLMKHGSDEIKTLLQECNNRCVFFHNKTENKKVMEKQAVDFFEMVESIKAFQKESEDENGNAVRSPLSDVVYNQNNNTESESLTVEAALNQSYSESSTEPLTAAITPAECGDDVQNNMQESYELIKRLDIGLQEGPGIASSESQRAAADPPTKPPVTALMLGRSDILNSWTANFILMKEAFEINCGFDNFVEKNFDSIRATFNGQYIRIVKGPGLVQNFNVSIFSQIVSECLGFILKCDAILYVIERDTEKLQEEINTVEHIERIMQRDVFREQGILVSVGSSGQRGKDHNESIKCDPNFQGLVAKFGDRVIFFNNQTRDIPNNESQVTDLINVIEHLRRN